MVKSENLSGIKRIYGKDVAAEVVKVATEHKLDPQTVKISIFDSPTGPETYEYEAEYHYYDYCYGKGPGWKRDVVNGRYHYCKYQNFQIIVPCDAMDAIKHQWEKLHPNQRLLGVAFGLHYDWNEHPHVYDPNWAWFYVKLWILPSLRPKVSYWAPRSVWLEPEETVTERIDVAKVEMGSNLYQNLEYRVYHLAFQKLFGADSLINDDSHDISRKTEAVRAYNKRYRELEDSLKEKGKALIYAAAADRAEEHMFNHDLAVNACTERRKSNRFQGRYDHHILNHARGEYNRVLQQFEELKKRVPGR